MWQKGNLSLTIMDSSFVIMKPKPGLIPRFNLDYSFKDFCYGVKSAFSGDEFDLKPLESIFGEKTFLFTSYGRSSLYVILKALNLPKGSKVGVPLYLCTVVFDAIIKAGHIPCFIDIDLDNYTMDTEDLEEKIGDLSAVVVVHTFGRPADMDKIGEIAGEKPVIEDCAHSLLSEYKGRKTGTLGDASFFSLAKYISAGGGGMIIVNNDGLTDRLQREIDTLKEPSDLNNIKHSFIVYMRSFFYHKPWFGLFALPIGLSIEDKVDLMTKRSFEVAGINKNDLSVMLKKLALFKKNVEMQRKNSFFLIVRPLLRSIQSSLPYLASQSRHFFDMLRVSSIRISSPPRSLPVFGSRNVRISLSPILLSASATISRTTFVPTMPCVIARSRTGRRRSASVCRLKFAIVSVAGERIIA